MTKADLLDNTKEVLEIYFALIEELGSISPDAGILAASIIHQTIKNAEL